jgi:nicotinamide mononucleotide transporter
MDWNNKTNMTTINLLDIIGATGAFLATIAYIKVSLWAWPLSLIAIFIDISLYYQKGIYGDMTLQFVYLIFTLYGWYQWKFGGNKHQGLQITSINTKQTLTLALIALISTYLMFHLLRNYTNSQIPFWDAITTILSLIAQWMVCRKIIENWFLWLLIDSIYLGMYFYKGIPVHAILQLIYFAMAVIGYRHWYKVNVLNFELIKIQDMTP